MRCIVAFIAGILICGAAYAQAPSSTLVIPTISNFPTGTAANLYPSVRALGYYTAGDGGGGDFLLTTTGNSADACMAFTAVSGKKYIRQLPNNVLSLLQCGVKADGSTDNSTAMQAAFNAVGTYSLGEIYCPASANTIKFGTSIAPVAGSTFRGQANTLKPYLGLSGDAPGACHLVFTGSSGWAIDFQTAVASTCPNNVAPRFYNFTLENTGAASGIRLNNAATAGYTDSCSGGSPGQNTLYGAVFDNLVMYNGNRVTTAIQFSKAFKTTVSNNTFAQWDTQVDAQGSDNVEIFNNSFNIGLLQEVLLTAHGTFGNFNNIRDNVFNSIYTNASYFINTSARSGIIDGNYFETDFAGLTSVLNVGCGLSQTITNNAMELLTANISYWLTVTGDCIQFTATNNYGGGGGGVPALWNTGSGAKWFANATKQKIVAWGNPDNNGNLPFNTAEPQPVRAFAPTASGAQLGYFDASSPNSIGGAYAASLYVKAGAFVLPASTTPTGQITFKFTPRVSGTADIWVYASVPSAATNQVLTVSDGVSTTTTTLNGGATAAWYKVISNDVVNDATITTENADTGHNNTINIQAWEIVQH